MDGFIKLLREIVSPGLAKLVLGSGWIVALIIEFLSPGFVFFEFWGKLSIPEKVGYCSATILSVILLGPAAIDLWSGYQRRQEEKRQRSAKEFRALAGEIENARSVHNLARSVREKTSRAEFQRSRVFDEDISAKKVLRARLYELGIRAPLVSLPAGQGVDEKTEYENDVEWGDFLTELHSMAKRGNIEQARLFTRRRGYPSSRDATDSSYLCR